MPRFSSSRKCSSDSSVKMILTGSQGTFYVKEGHSTIAWRLVSAAARACLDLGFHRLPNSPENEEVLRQSTIFWHTYLWDKGLAMTCGRTPVIHHYDVTNCYPVNSDYLRMMPGRLVAPMLNMITVLTLVGYTPVSLTIPSLRGNPEKAIFCISTTFSAAEPCPVC